MSGNQAEKICHSETKQTRVPGGGPLYLSSCGACHWTGYHFQDSYTGIEYHFATTSSMTGSITDYVT